ncbi:MAG: hypothetical protein U9Q77_06835 [Candidatus Marinimicrobia bacterium]|nr:hypothetical protein [Candidatus Neomarinimicrobiota bacterium]
MKRYSLQVLLLALTLIFVQCSMFGGKSAPEEESWDKSEKNAEVKDRAEVAGVDANSTDESAWQSGEQADNLIYNLDQLKKNQPEQGASTDFVTGEINYEVKRLAAELKYVKKKLTEIQTQSEVWTNPLSIYSKEVHLENGTKLFGDVIDQDKENIQVKTLIGVLTVSRDQVVRIVDNIPTEPGAPAVTEPGSRRGGAPMNINNNQSSMAGTQDVKGDTRESKYTGNVVLSGSIRERKDRSGNTILSGIVKNIGGRRADFVKVNFLFRINWSGDTRELTAFVKGSHHVFSSGVNTDTSLFPGASGEFELYVPKSFGSFIGYSYSIDWEEHDI